ncbi:TIGR03986 family type III CRISPR-associated RAMP protein [Intestinibacter sp.]
MANYIKDSTAPYNFIRLPIDAFIKYGSSKELPTYESYRKDLNTGYIDYEFINETPLFVGNQKNENNNVVEFFKNANKQICIPGSSMRGAIRKNTEIIGFGYPEFIEDSLFLYRKFASTGAVKKEYKQVITAGDEVSIENVVEAGYIYKDGDDYKLIPAKKVNNKTFFSVNEIVLRKNRLEEGDRKVQYMYNSGLLNFKYHSDIPKEKEKEWENWARKNNNRGYKPYKTNIHFDIDRENKIKNIKLTQNKKEINGILFNSNHMGKKKKHYIINEIDKNAKTYTIEVGKILAYNQDCETNKQRKNPRFYELPKKNGIGFAEPFFYIIDKNQKVSYFGKCPYLRIFFDQSIRKCIKTGFARYGIDYPNAIYGYTVESKNDGPLQGEKNNFKGRVSFSDVVCEKAKIINGEKHLVLSSPKPTSYTNYLIQTGETDEDIITYNNREAEIRGNKFYWMKDVDMSRFNNLDPKQKRILTNIKNVLDKNNKFKGKIYFENLSDDELGLLLLSLKYNNKTRESIGMGKPYGLGRININKINLYLEDIDSKFTSLDNSYRLVKDIEVYKEKYKKFMSKNIQSLGYKESKFEDIPEIEDYISSKTEIMDESDTRYMRFNEFKEWTVLPDAYKML